jgi:hypothetical protein
MWKSRDDGACSRQRGAKGRQCAKPLGILFWIKAVQRRNADE